MTRVLVILNDPPYGSERSWNGLRLAGELARTEGVEVKVFCFGDAVGCAVAGQVVPDGWYHLDRMVTGILHHGSEVGCCGTCMDARAVGADALVEGVCRATLKEASEWVIWADRVVTY